MRPGPRPSPCAGAALAIAIALALALAIAIGLALVERVAYAQDGRGLLDPPVRPAAAQGTGSWIDSRGADHRQRDAERRARESPPALPVTGAAAGEPGAQRPDAGEPGAQRPDGGAPGTRPPPGAADPAQAEALRRQGERERDARSRRGGPAAPTEPVPRIRPDAPPSPAMSPPPRIAIPQPGEPGGPPIAVPTCGPAGCFDANGRALPDAGPGMPTTPGGRPCIRLGNAVTC